MCFRPAEVSMKTCPECGKVNKPVAVVCEACGAELEKTQAEFDANQGALDAMGESFAKSASTGAPAPKAPGAPKPPAAPPAPHTGK